MQEPVCQMRNVASDWPLDGKNAGVPTRNHIEY